VVAPFPVDCTGIDAIRPGAEVPGGDRRFPSGLGERSEIVEHSLRVPGDLLRRDDVGELDDAVRVDDVGDAARIVDVGVARVALGVVGAAGNVIRVGEQRERESVRLGKGEVVLRRVERDAEDRGVQRFEFRGSVTEPAALQRSTGGGRLRVPPQHDPFLSKVGQGDRPSVLVDGIDRRSFGSGKQHDGGA
jgi:hypothetical protein